MTRPISVHGIAPAQAGAPMSHEPPDLWHDRPPPLDPTRAIHVWAMLALIEMELRPGTVAAAQSLLRHLIEGQVATADFQPGHARLTIHGITATVTGPCTPAQAATALRKWQSAALQRLGCRGPMQSTDGRRNV